MPSGATLPPSQLWAYKVMAANVMVDVGGCSDCQDTDCTYPQQGQSQWHLLVAVAHRRAAAAALAAIWTSIPQQAAPRRRLPCCGHTTKEL